MLKRTIAAAVTAATLTLSTPAGAGELGDFMMDIAKFHREHGTQWSWNGRDAAPKGPARSVLASFYGGGERLNPYTASGERFKPAGLTAAHRSLPLGTRLLVHHHGRSVVVRVNDRGPAKKTGRDLDLSRGAAAHLGMISRGVANVNYTVLSLGHGPSRPCTC